MEALIKTWGALSLNKKLTAVGATLATLLLVFFLVRTASQPSMSLLYGGLDSANAGEVLGALEQMGVPTEVRGDAVYVPGSERDRVRLELARQGLPQQSQEGYELLKDLSGFGTTNEMFQAAYWQAKQGELARTILSVPGVKTARVHIGAAARRPFARSSDRSTAAVTVTMSNGRLSEQTALSIRYLVALAVADLDPTQVAVIDAKNGVILKPGEEKAGTQGAEEAERRAQRLREELEELLAVRVGRDAVRISVNIETTRESKKVSEHIVDPDSQVPVNSKTEEVLEKNVEPSQAVTVASNLPDGDANNGGAPGQSDRSRTSEEVSYKYSETRRDEVTEAGAIKRLGVAVLVDQIREVAADGASTFTPRPAEELAAIEELVKSAVAFDAERGDTVTVESMRFQPIEVAGEEVEISMIERLVSDNLMTVVQLGFLALVALALGMFVVRPILLSAPEAAMVQERAALEAANAAALASQGVHLVGPDGEELSPEEAAQMAAKGESEPKTSGEAAAMNKQDIEETRDEITRRSNLETLVGLIGTRPDDSAELLKGWLNNEGQPVAEKAAA